MKGSNALSPEEIKLLIKQVDGLPIRGDAALPMKDIDRQICDRTETPQKKKSFHYLTHNAIDHMLPIGGTASPLDQTTLYLLLRDRGQPIDHLLQKTIDDMLRDVASGTPPETVFQHRPRKESVGGIYEASRESQLRCLEVLRLTELMGDEPAAKDRVAGAFDVDIRTVERALEEWSREMLLDRVVVTGGLNRTVERANEKWTADKLRYHLVVRVHTRRAEIIRTEGTLTQYVANLRALGCLPATK